MKPDRVIAGFAKNKGFSFLIVFAAVILCLSYPATAQSGRRAAKNAVAPKPAETPAAKIEASAANEPAPEINSLVAVGKIVHNYDYFRSTTLDTALKELVYSLRSYRQTRLDVSRGDEMSFEEAKEQVKKAQNTYVLWLGFVAKTDAFGNMYIDHTEYILLEPQTGKHLAAGKVEPGNSGSVVPGTAIRTSKSARRTHSLSQMKQTAREIAARLLRSGWLD